MADALMKYETIDSKQIDQIMDGHEPDPPSGWQESESEPESSETVEDAGDSSGHNPIGGPAEQV